MMPHVLVRRYELLDRDAVLTFVPHADLDPGIARDAASERLTDPWWIAVEDREVIGLLEGRLAFWFADDPWPVSGNQGWIYNLGVARDHRRRGVGTALVEGFIAAAREVSVEYVGLSVNRNGDEQGRILFFESCGFELLRPVAFQEATYMGRWTTGAQPAL